ncbi:MAG: phosphoglycerate mutase family protein, partial [Oscillospiraceae bacterium]
MKGYRLSILRHGHTSANNDGRYIGSTDLPLSDEGREELVNKFNVSDYP